MAFCILACILVIVNHVSVGAAHDVLTDYLKTIANIDFCSIVVLSSGYTHLAEEFPKLSLSQLPPEGLDKISAISSCLVVITDDCPSLQTLEEIAETMTKFTQKELVLLPCHLEEHLGLRQWHDTALDLKITKVSQTEQGREV